MSWRTKWKIREFLQNSIWVVPAIFVALAIAMGVALPDLDKHTSTQIGLAYGAGAAQGMLGAMAGGMITFTGFVFSILLLAVQFGSSQFSPRMLRRFLRDPTTKISLGMFMATFVYALFVLRAIEPANDDTFIPDFSITVSIFLLLASMLMFLRLISRTTQGLRVAAVLRDLGNDGLREIEACYPEPAGAAAKAADLPASDPGTPVKEVRFGDAEDPGILQSVDFEGLAELARKAGVKIELVPPIGDHMIPGDPLFRIHGDASAVGEDVLQKSIAIADERTMTQDPAFIFRLLADISSKALSPGVNDPTTSVQALDQIECLLRLLAGRDLDRGTVRDAEGQVRLTFPSPSWKDFLSIALDETRIFGEGSIQVSRRMRSLLEDLLEQAPADRRPAVARQLVLLKASVRRTFAEKPDRKLARTGDRQGVGTPR